MPGKNKTPEQIIGILRDAEILLAEGHSVAAASRKLGVSELSYYRWRKEYGGMKVEQAKRLKDLEAENRRLKKIVADQVLGMEILQEALEKKL